MAAIPKITAGTARSRVFLIARTINIIVTIRNALATENEAIILPNIFFQIITAMNLYKYKYKYYEYVKKVYIDIIYY